MGIKVIKMESVNCMGDKKRALIAMSGGVDSSVAVYLMQKAGYDCVGATMRLYEAQSNEENADETVEKIENTDDRVYDEEAACGSSSAVNDAKAVAKHFGIPFHAYDYREDFKDEVICRFINTYIEGGTPNPCVECNRYMKFGRFMDKMREENCDCVVTGHYARVEYDTIRGQYVLKKGLDERKDQSYVLYNLTKDQLAHCKFPLGEYSKEEIREIADTLGLSNANKKDSQDICFVPDGDYASFIETYTGQSFAEGNFVNREGKVLGRHKGMIRYTIGQRKGLGLALQEPMYVYEKRMDTNEVVLCRNEELFSSDLLAADVNWIIAPENGKAIHCKAKARYKQKEADAVVECLSDNRVKVSFIEPQRGITRGQSVVFYDGDTVLGGGRIL